jgi:hypothetical protein
VEERTGEWRNSHSEKLNDTFCSPKVIQTDQSGDWVGAVAGPNPDVTFSRSELPISIGH